MLQSIIEGGSIRRRSTHKKKVKPIEAGNERLAQLEKEHQFYTSLMDFIKGDARFNNIE